MIELRFSARYSKMPPPGGATFLLEVLPVERGRLGLPFLGYDTKPAAGQALCINPESLAKGGPWLVLLLLTRDERGQEHLWTTVRRRKPGREKQLLKVRGQAVRIILPGDVVRSQRTAPFVRRFQSDKRTVCPGFYNLVLSTGCQGRCTWCYLQGTLRGQKFVRLYNNPWEQVQRELEAAGPGVFNCGELADSLLTEPPLLEPAIEWFRGQEDKTLLLVTKAWQEARCPLTMQPHPQVVVSASINAIPAAEKYELRVPGPIHRLVALEWLKNNGWRVRVRLDPVVLLSSLRHYQYACLLIKALGPERVTVGSLRPYPPVAARLPAELKEKLVKDGDGRMRYPLEWRVEAYQRIADWLGSQPALCKETPALWKALGWEWAKCNCQE